MLRDKNLIPLSHQHQHALALCVRIDRASPISESDVFAWQAEIAQIFVQEIQSHFKAEEQVLFPAARRFEELVHLVDDLTTDHSGLRQRFSSALARKMAPGDITELGLRLSTHIRKEERQLFENLQRLLDPSDMEKLGSELDEALKSASHACALPNDVTRLRSAR